MKDEWQNEKVWIDIEQKHLYPPFDLIKKQEASGLIKDIEPKGKRVLDNGCGTGWFGEMLKMRGADVVGTDISDTLLSVARERMSVAKASSYNLPFNDNSFDIVLFFMVIHILDDPNKALDEIYRVLKTGGLLFLAFVHPRADLWNLATKKRYIEFSNYSRVEKRNWVFNLTDKNSIIKHYVHRPWSYYKKILSRKFEIISIIEPKLPKKYLTNGLYAKREYMLLKLIK